MTFLNIQNRSVFSVKTSSGLRLKRMYVCPQTCVVREWYNCIQTSLGPPRKSCRWYCTSIDSSVRNLKPPVSFSDWTMLSHCCFSVMPPLTLSTRGLNLRDQLHRRPQVKHPLKIQCKLMGFWGEFSLGPLVQPAPGRLWLANTLANLINVSCQVRHQRCNNSMAQLGGIYT